VATEIIKDAVGTPIDVERRIRQGQIEGAYLIDVGMFEHDSQERLEMENILAANAII